MELGGGVGNITKESIDFGLQEGKWWEQRYLDYMESEPWEETWELENATSLKDVREDIDIPQKIKNRSTRKPTISLLGVYSKELKARNWTGICTPMFRAKR